MRGAYILVAILAVSLTSVAGQIDFDTNGCTECPPCYHGTILKLPINWGVDDCRYCECDANSQPHIKSCENGYGFDMTLQTCVKRPECGQPDRCGKCDDCYEGMDYKVPDNENPCGYCVCTWDGEAVPQECPPMQGWDDKHKKCVPMDECCRWNDCDIECDQCYHGMQKRHPNPAWPCSFCCCLPANDSTTFEVGYYKECPEGQEYSEWEDKCVPSWREECQHPRPPVPPECNTCRDCSDVICPNDGKYELIPNPSNSCSYCCCSDWDGDGAEEGKEIKCEDVLHQPGEFDPIKKVCVPSNKCEIPPECIVPTWNPPPTCPPPPKMCEVTCPTSHYGEWYRLANPVDKCSFCCCTPEYPGGPEYPEVKSCGTKLINGVEVQMGYDPITDECSIRNAECLEIPPPPPGCVSGDDWCPAMVSLCPADRSGGLLPNPGDTSHRSYCQCDWGKIHWMPCAPGTTFDPSVSVCV